MSRDQIKAHLDYFEELGVDGIRREPEWRGRSGADPLGAPKPRSGEGRLGPRSEPDPSTGSGSSRALSRDERLAPQEDVVPVFSSPDAALKAIRDDLGDCTRCKLHRLGRRQIVYGTGNPNADLMFVGEAPGADEDIQGEPFVGRAGQLLTKIIEAIGLTRADVYIANVIKCRPPGNRNPEPDEVEQCEPFLFRQIDTIKPKVIVALGKFAAQCLLRTTDPITRLRGREFTYRDAILIPTYHPAYLLRTPSAKRDVWDDMKKVRSILAGE